MFAWTENPQSNNRECKRTLGARGGARKQFSISGCSENAFWIATNLCISDLYKTTKKISNAKLSSVKLRNHVMPSVPGMQNRSNNFEICITA